MKKVFLLVPVFMVLFSCEKEAHEHNDEELITTVNMVFTDADDGSLKYFSFKDIDGDGGNAPIISSDTLDANSNYTVAITLLNESETPAENITIEVEEEGEEHQFFFITSTGLPLSFTYDDADASGNPIGLQSIASTGTASTGTLSLTLRHEPNKLAANVASGDISNAGGATDIEVVFDVVIE